MRRLCPSTSLKPDPGLRVSRVRHRRLHRASTLSVSLRLSLTHPFSPTSASIASLGSLSFDYCFVKCDVKDSKITPIRVASIVLAIKPVLAHSLFSVISLSPSRRLICRRIAIPSLPHSVFFLPLPPPLSLFRSSSFVAKGQVQFAQIQIYPRVTFPRGAN